MAPKNVVIFGETGAGKSSIINMIKGGQVAAISSAAVGCTFESAAYIADIAGSTFRLHDTAGLNEGQDGTVPAKDALVNLYKLICRLEGGISLLVYCIRGPRVKDTTVKNYNIFYEAFCQKQVPIAVVVTGLENEEPTMEDWWAKNEDTFVQYGMSFDGHACVTATKGKRNMFEAEYEESAKSVKDLVYNSCRALPWQKERHSWFAAVLKAVWNMFTTTFNIPLSSIGNTLTYALTLIGVPKGEAGSIANGVEFDLAT
jgi:GTPase Era involved in 16S rRNA processing